MIDKRYCNNIALFVFFKGMAAEDMKTKTINVRVDKATLDMVIKESKKTNKNISQYIRDLILSTDVRTDPEIKMAINDLRKEINRIGVNINQIAKNTNAGIYSETDRINLIERQKALLKEFKKMKERINNTS